MFKFASISFLLLSNVAVANDPTKTPPMMFPTVTIMQKVVTTERMQVQVCHGSYCSLEWRNVQVTKEVPVEVLDIKQPTKAKVKIPPLMQTQRVTNGYNCRAGFCKANGGTGCPNCPNSISGKCACGSK